jgi:hypothetical protein
MNFTNSKLNERAIKSLLRLALAERAFQEADAIIDHILRHKFDPDITAPLQFVS